VAITSACLDGEEPGFPAVARNLAAAEALDQRRHVGLPVLALAFGESGLLVHPALKLKLAAAAGYNAYGAVAGDADLRRAVAGYWQRRGITADPDLVVCGPGSKPLLFALLLALGGDVVLPRPSWVSYAMQARLAHVRPLFVATRPGEGGVPDPDELTTAVTLARSQGRHVRSVIVTVPDNPTGTLPTPQTVRRLCQAARDLDLTIISDEIYRDLVFAPGVDFPSPSR
jgi:aspartate aminotransferase